MTQEKQPIMSLEQVREAKGRNASEARVHWMLYAVEHDVPALCATVEKLAKALRDIKNLETHTSECGAREGCDFCDALEAVGTLVGQLEAKEASHDV